MQNLSELPNDILLMIADNLHNIKDFNFFLQTNRYLSDYLYYPFLLRVIGRNLGMTALFYAARYGNEAYVRLLLEKASFKIYKSGWLQVYYQGPGQPSNEVVKLVLANKFHLGLPEVVDGPYTPLHWAVKMQDWRMAEMVLDYNQGAGIDKMDKGGRTALYRAVESGDATMVKMLLKYGAKLNKQGGITPLQVATNLEHIDIAKLLLEREAGRKTCVSWVRDRSGDYIPGGGFGQLIPGPIYLATMYLDKSLVKLWLKNEIGGGSIFGKDNDGRTALHIAAESSEEVGTEIIRLLLEHLPGSGGAWRNMTGVGNISADKDGRTPLHLASLNGYNSVKPLLDAGVYVDHRDKMWRTPLHNHLIETSYSSMVVDVLLRNGAKVKAQDFDGRNPIHMAVRNRYVSAIAIAQLIDFGGVIAINAKDRKGRTPLHEAAGRGDKTIARLLLRSGSNAMAKDKNGKTPCDFARDLGYSEEYLRLFQESQVDFGPEMEWK